MLPDMAVGRVSRAIIRSAPPLGARCSSLRMCAPPSQAGLTAAASRLASALAPSIRGGAQKQVIDLDRATFRIEGMETYSLVMALFMGSALALLSQTPIKLHPWDEMKKSKSKFAESVASALFCACCTYAVISSGFTTILFTLTSLYSKTALGLGLDVQYNKFLDETGFLRFFGFQSFMRAIKTFAVSFLLSIFLACEGRARWTVPLVPSAAAIMYGRKLQQLIDLATKLIFAPPSN